MSHAPGSECGAAARAAAPSGREGERGGGDTGVGGGGGDGEGGGSRSALHPVWQRQASSACHRFRGAAPNQEWRAQRGPARVWPTSQQKSRLFSRAPTQNLSSAARRHARRRRRKISSTSSTCRFHEEMGSAGSCTPDRLPKKPRNACDAFSIHFFCLGPPAPRPRNMRLPKAHRRQSGKARRDSGAQTVMAQRVWGGVGRALLNDRGNGSKHRRLTEDAHSRGASIGVRGYTARATTKPLGS